MAGAGCAGAICTGGACKPTAALDLRRVGRQNSSVRSFVPITIDSTWVAVDMSTVREIGGPVTWIALPTATAALPGVAAWRGRAVAVADLAAVLGAGERLSPPTGRVRTLYLQQGASTLAVPVDAVREPLTVADHDIRPPRARTESFCTGELDVEGHTTLIVDLGAFLDGHRPAVASGLH
jgi:chemotaxis signal transduction protein